MPTPHADILLSQVYQQLGLQNVPDSQKYESIEQIVATLQQMNQTRRISIGTTGAITERLCGLGLAAVKLARPGVKVRKSGKDWQWIGDLLIPGHPYDLTVSIKSFKAKERLLASGTGSLLTPTIGWGLFDDPLEWSEARSRSYLYRGFLAIYMPGSTHSAVSASARNICSINGRPLLRDLADFPNDVISAIPDAMPDRVDVRKI